MRAHLMGSIQRKQYRGHTAAQYDFRRMRIGKDVELRKGRDVAALTVCTAHDHQLPDMVRDVRRHDQRCRHIGHRPGDDDRNFIRPGRPKSADQGVDGMRRTKRGFRFEWVETRYAALAVKILSRYRQSQYGPRASGKDRYVLASHKIAHHPCIPAGQMQRNIPSDRCDGPHIQRRAGQRHHQHDGIIHAGIAVNYQGKSRHQAPQHRLSSDKTHDNA